MRNTPKLALVALSLATLFLWPRAAVAGGGGHGGPCGGFGSGATMVLRDSCFDQAAFSASPRSVLVVKNEGGLPHTFTAVDGSFDTGLLDPGESARVTMGDAGLVKVYCTLHGTASGGGMSGLVIVGDPALTDTAAGSTSPDVQAAIDQQTAQLLGEIDARASGLATVRTELEAVTARVTALEGRQINVAGMLGAAGTVLGGSALALAYFKRRSAAI